MANRYTAAPLLDEDEYAVIAAEVERLAGLLTLVAVVWLLVTRDQA
jgi:hypothetical protein